MNVWSFNVITNGPAPKLILSTPKLLVFMRLTSLDDVVDVIANVNHMLYFVLAT